MASLVLQSCRLVTVRAERTASSSPAPAEDNPRASPARITARKTPRIFSSRNSPTATAVAATAATPASSPPLIEDRKKAAQEHKEASPFRVTEVDAAEQKDFYEAPVLNVADVAQGVRCITVEAEVSREFVPLDKAYTKPGQSVQLRLPTGAVASVPVSSAPFSGETNFGVLYKLRGDIPAGSTKAPQYALSVRCPMDLHVAEKKHPELYSLKAGDSVEVGQFERNGMDLRPIMFLSRFPTLLIFASGPGAGVAAARALVEAQDVGSLYTNLRSEVRLYLTAPNPEDVAYQKFFPKWESLNVKVRPVVSQAGSDWPGQVGDFATVFDEDDLEYDPETTAAIVCGDAASNTAALKVLDEAGIPRKSVIVWETKC